MNEQEQEKRCNYNLDQNKNIGNEKIIKKQTNRITIKEANNINFKSKKKHHKKGGERKE
jgi:hypothetical protein